MIASCSGSGNGTSIKEEEYIRLCIFQERLHAIPLELSGTITSIAVRM